MTTVRFRPRLVRWVAIGFSVLLPLAALAGFYALPAEIRARFNGFQIGTLVFFIVVMIAIMLSLGFSTLWVTDQGLRIRNGLRTHFVAWADLGSVRFRDGDPWPTAYLAGREDEDHDHVKLLGIQSSDGELSRQQFRQLKEIVRVRGSGTPA